MYGNFPTQNAVHTCIVYAYIHAGLPITLYTRCIQPRVGEGPAKNTVYNINRVGQIRVSVIIGIMWYVI